jgi:hypothetical protein
VQGILRGEAGVRQVDDVHLLRETFLEHPAEHGLAAAHLADDLDDALATRDGVAERLQDLAAVAAGIEELRIRRYAERGAFEAEVVVIHRCRCRRRSGP